MVHRRKTIWNAARSSSQSYACAVWMEGRKNKVKLRLRLREPPRCGGVLAVAGNANNWLRGPTMTLCPYNSDELKQLHRVLEGIIREAQQRNLTLAVDDIIERVLDLADHGERDPEKLRETVLKCAA